MTRKHMAQDDPEPASERGEVGVRASRPRAPASAADLVPVLVNGAIARAYISAAKAGIEGRLTEASLDGLERCILDAVGMLGLQLQGEVPTRPAVEHAQERLREYPAIAAHARRAAQ